jgi:hypothetical protein
MFHMPVANKRVNFAPCGRWDRQKAAAHYPCRSVKNRKIMQSLIESKKLAFAFALSILMALQLTNATVRPSVNELTRWSDVIVVGKVLNIAKRDNLTKIVTIEVKEFIKPNIGVAVRRLKTLSLHNHQIGIQGFNFQLMKEKSAEFIFFLAYVPDRDTIGRLISSSFHLELTDGWFGIEDSNQDLINHLRQVEQRVERIYENSNLFK